METDKRNELLENGYKAEVYGNPLKTIIIVFLSFSIPSIGPLFLIFKSIKNFTKKKTRFYRYEKVTLYKSDKRYKTGRRPDGYKKVKSYYDEKIPSTSKEIKSFKIKAYVALALGLLFLGTHLSYINQIDQETVQESGSDLLFGIVTADKGLHLRNDSTINSEVLITIPKGDTIEIQSMGNTQLTIGDITANWYNVKYDTTYGWAWGGYIEILEVFNRNNVIGGNIFTVVNKYSSSSAETLEGTNNDIWIVYYEDINTTFKVDKKSNAIL